MNLACLTLLLIAGPPGEAPPDEPPGDFSRLHRIQTASSEELRSLLRYTGDRLPIVSAHRGGSYEGFPENALETYANTISHTFSLLEIDTRFTKDGQIVLHHDETLDRTTTGTGRLQDYTLAELKQLRLVDRSGRATAFQIPTLDEAFDWARGKAILVLDKKVVPLERCIAEIQKHDAEGFAMIITGSVEQAQTCHRLAPGLMMECFVGDRRKLEAFDASGVPWSSIVAFVGHQPPEDPGLLRMIHERGALCMAGTSRHLDRELVDAEPADMPELRRRYLDLLDGGVDLLETDRPLEVGPIVSANADPTERQHRFLQAPRKDKDKASAGPN
ncbi:glycerophosphodiester phosphodiesterase family protein [Alienimonas chondri]|uniref:GP-PDE domain-containing protein n=1 Tax=Alienimonas chondri TaxID=2681879 RepID=A0ABX1V7Z4_9PLAN|nr:glycerophosphodiester phosphodiesterase family protein [Alienimonas chondri]NNJ24284.1 hypothetical protein [Alienimonas chondri]